MAQNSIFRKVALDRLASPEQLDHLIRFVPPLRTLLRDAATALRLPTRDSTVQRARTPTVLQMESLECGAAALAMVLGFHGRHVPLEELRVACGVSRDGSKASNIVRAARTYGMLAKGFKKEPEQLADLPLPLIAFVNFDHFVVVEGFAPGKVFLNDPAVGPRTISSEEFDQSFTGVALVFTPSPDFQPGGSRPSPLAALRRRLTGFGAALTFAAFLSVALIMILALLASLLPGLIDGARDGIPLVLAAGLAYVALTWLRALSLARTEAQIAERGGAEFMRHALRLPVAFFSQRHSGEIAARALLNAELGRLLAGLLPALFDAVLALGLLLVLARFDLLLASVAAVTAVLHTLVLAALGLRADDRSAQLAQDRGKLYGATYSGIQLIETLQAGGAESDAFARWAGHQARVVSVEQQANALSIVRAGVPWLITGLGMVAMVLIAGQQMAAGTLSGGELFTALLLLIAVLQPLTRLLPAINAARSAVSITNRLDDVLRHPSDPLLEGSADQGAARLSGTLELRNLTFGYSRLSPPLITDVSLTLQPGRRVALVGGSGSGKSTLARLVAGLYEPWEGEILFDGKPRSAWPRSVITRSLAMVDQEIALFAGTIGENITLWDTTIDTATIERAAHDAAIDTEILARTGGYNGSIASGGTDLSGGQRQRLEIARALIRDPAILILDEATSALDPLSEQVIDARLRSRGCACLIIAHRLSTVRDADEIIVLEQGQVVQRGTHSELIAVPGPYADLFAAEEPADNSDPPAMPDEFAADESNEPHQAAESLLAACRLIGAALGVEVRQPAQVGVLHEPLAAIIDGSGLRSRRVALRDEWWSETGLPLLAFRKQDRAAVALLPNGTNGYLLIDPRDSQRRPLTPALADELASFGELLYRTLPDEPLDPWGLLGWMLRGSAGEPGLLAAAGWLYGLLMLALPLSVGMIISVGIPWFVGLGLVLAVLPAVLLHVTAALSATRIIGRAISVLQAALWDRLLRQSAAFFHGRDPGGLGAQIIGIGAAVAPVTHGLATLNSHIPLIMLNLILLGVIDWRLSVTALAAAVGFFCFSGGLAWAGLRLERNLQREDARIATLALDLISGVVRIRTAGGEDRFLKRWSALLRRRAGAARRVGWFHSILASNSAIVLVSIPAYLTLMQTMRPTLEVAAVVTALIAFAQMMLAVGALSDNFGELLRLQPLYQQIGTLLRARPQHTNVAADPGELSGALVIEQVDFAYRPDTPLLRGISLEVRPGEFLAIVGPSGSGKSTLLRLLLGFEQPRCGMVRYDQRDLSDLDVRAVRRQIGVVLQNGQVIADDIYHNIVGVAPLSVERAWEAAQSAGLAEEIQALPMGMYTLVPEGGSTFSGGQRQRMLIARALVRRPPIVFFDEATSALDNTRQQIVSRSLSRMQATRIVIAHRLSTVINADRIIVLDGGRIVEEGTYAELVAHAGLFADLAKRQLA